MDARFTRLDFLPAPSEAEVAKAHHDHRPLAQGERPMLAIRDALRRRGFVATPVDIWESHGWVFSAEAGEARCSFMLQWSGEWLLMGWAHRSFADKLRGERHGAALDRACAAVSAAIAEGWRGHEARWANGPGDLKPVAA